MNWAAIVWLGLMLLFVVMELATVSMTSLWFAAGALVAVIASLLHAPVAAQVALFIAVSGVCLWLLRPIVKTHFTPKLTKTNVDAVIGKEGIVTAQVDNLQATGTVKLSGLEWSARSVDGGPIAPNTRVRVERIEGVKVYVTPVTDKITQEV